MSEPTTLNANAFNQNHTVLSNAVELASLVIANIDNDLIVDSSRPQDMTLEAIRTAVIERLQTKLNIKD